ncbi:hypothetical protein NL676_010433 [Syzygium grande]|nr:hypothetical protein NL676_010433 [Syzygium grande]
MLIKVKSFCKNGHAYNASETCGTLEIGSTKLPGKSQAQASKDMSVARKLTPNTRFSSLSLDKFIKSRKNLSKPTPKLWPDVVKRRILIPNDEEFDVLTLAHPILRRLESCNVRESNQVHVQLVVTRLSKHSLATNRAVKKLCSLREVAHAATFFQCTQEPDVFLCNTIMRTYVYMYDACSAMRFYYDEMGGNDVAPNHYKFPIVVKGFVMIGSSSDAEKVHGRVLKLGFESDLFGLCWIWLSWNSMIDGHVKNGEVDVACELFDEMTKRDVFSWNSMIAGDLNKGHLIYAYMKDNEIEADVLLSTALLTMYAKCGTMDLAKKVFDQMPDRSVVSCNAMIVGILSAYTHSGMVLEGRSCFNLMSRVYNIQPKVEHYGCMVDLLARAGLVKDSGELFKEVPTEAGSSQLCFLPLGCRRECQDDDEGKGFAKGSQVQPHSTWEALNLQSPQTMACPIRED